MPKSPKLPRGPRKGKKRAGGGKAGKKFEGTPITAETKFETQASPMRSTAQAARPVRKPKGTRRRIVKGHRAPAKGHRDVGKNEPDHDKYWMFPR